MSDSENDIFGRKPRINRSPKKQVQEDESGIVKDFMNLSKNCEKIESNLASGESNIAQPNQSELGGRKSVSFQIPTTSSTLYQPADDSQINLLDFDSEINFDPNITSAALDPFAGAQSTYSDLAGISFRLSESNIQNRPFPIHSLVYLAQAVCISCEIDYSTVFAESSSLKHLFINSFENRVRSNNSVNKTETVIQAENPEGEQQETNMTGINAHSIVRGIDKFSWKNREDVESFIANIELFDDLCGTSDDLKLIVLKTVRSRLKAITLLGNVQSLTLIQIIARIREKFKLSMTFDAAQEKLLSIQQGSKESIDNFGERVKNLLDIMNTESADTNDAIQNAKAKMNENLAIRKFKQNLFNSNVRMMALSATHSDLYEAVSFANEKLEEMRMSNVRQEQPKNSTNTLNVQKSNTAEKDKKEKMFCHICKRKNHMTKDCFAKKNNQQNDNSQSNKQSENTNKSFDGKKFNRAGKSRSMNQASGGNANESGDDDDEQIFESEEMPLRTFGAHLNH